MPDDADMRIRRLDRRVLRQRLKLGGAPCITQYGTQCIAWSLHNPERASEFLGDEHEALVGHACIDLLDHAVLPELRDRITDVKDHALARGEATLDVISLPIRVRDRHKLADAPEGCSLAPLRGRARCDDEQFGP